MAYNHDKSTLLTSPDMIPNNKAAVVDLCIPTIIVVQSGLYELHDID